MGSFFGKVVRVGLNAVTPKHSLRWASPTNKGLSKFINGTQKDVGNGVIRFQYGLKHKVVNAGYNESLHKYHDLAISPDTAPGQLQKIYDNVPRCLHQAMRELSELMCLGVKV